MITKTATEKELFTLETEGGEPVVEV